MAQGTCIHTQVLEYNVHAYTQELGVNYK